MSGNKDKISLLILLFVNFLFTYKYLDRFTGNGLVIAGIFSGLQILVFRYGHRLSFLQKRTKAFILLLSLGITGVVVITQLKIDLTTLKVDRWSVISSFWQEAFNGNYPYFAKSHEGNYPGPMPVYFLIALPFYLAGILSVLSASGYLILLYLWFKQKEKKATFALLFLLATSVYMYWEITTRSNIFTNSILILLILRGFAGINSKTKPWKFILTALLTGFLLSTRSVFVLVYLVFFLSALRNREIEFKRISLFLTIAVLAFAGSFLPFILLFKDDFFTINPFIIQSSFLVPQVYTLAFMIIALFLAFLVNTDFHISISTPKIYEDEEASV